MSSMQKNACLSCRQKKLKCDRQQPCANCVARSFECRQQQLPPPASRGTKRPHEDDGQAETYGPSTISSILYRLDQIEAYIHTAKSKDGGSSSVSNSIGEQVHSIRTIASTSSLDLGVPTPSASETPRMILSEGRVQLGKVGENDNIMRRALSHDLCITVSTTSEIRQETEPREIQLPPKQEASRLFRVYFDYLGPYQRFVHKSQAPEIIDHVYNEVTSHVPATTAPRGLALILSVVALAITLQPLRSTTLDAAILELKDRLVISAVYIRATMDCLEQHRRSMDNTLENVQAMIVLLFLINHIEAFSTRYRSLLAEAVMVSHTLGLHMIDAKGAKEALSQEQVDPVKQEISRRVWWYLSATDWMVSMAEGQFHAVYFIQPNLSITNKPKHVNDDDLGKPNVKEKPLSEPTEMSYFLHRVKLSEIARRISEVLPNDPNETTTEMVLSLDSKIESLIQDLPSFLRIESMDSPEAARINQEYPYVPMQRVVINMLINLVRCKLHYSYLPGNPNQSLHVFSRHTSLKAARKVLEGFRDISTLEFLHSADFMKIQGTVHHMFMGALILATDLCCNRNLVEDFDRQCSEVKEVLDRLEGIKQYSQIAGKFLHELTQLLVEYKVWPAPAAAPMAESEGELALITTSFGGVDAGDLGQVDFDAPFPFDSLWDTFVSRPSALDMIDIL